MNALQRLNAKRNGQPTDQPLFCPAIYEHKARLIGKRPTDIAQDVDLLAKAVLAEYEIYKPDMLTVGVDVYNIEAEALGCRVHFPDAIDAVPVITERVLTSLGDSEHLPKIDPEKTARMPLMLQAAEVINKKVGGEVLVRGSVSGPFSMAAELMGIEPALMAMLTEPESFRSLLDLCTMVAIDYSTAFIKRGLSVCIFDSQASPPLLSPDLYEDFILPGIVKLNKACKNASCALTEYVIGGKTDAIAAMMMQTGCDVILSDYPSDAATFINNASSGQLIRRNISPILIEKGDSGELRQQIEQVKILAATHPNVIIGTGVLSYNVPTENILTVKELCLNT